MVYQFLKEREEAGASLTQAIKELARLCCVGERSVWRWYDGSPTPPYAERLMTIWRECNEDQRRVWFE